MFNKFPRRSGIYRINDNVEQLQLRLQLRHINSPLKLPKFDLNKSAVENWRLRHATVEANKADKVQEITMKWQEKIMSVHEMKHYRESSNCVAGNQERYNAWLLAGGGARVGEGVPPLDTADEKQLQAKSKSKKRKRRKDQQTQQETTTEADEHIFTYIDEDKHQPAEANQAVDAKDNLKPAITCDMFIYATLQSRDTLLITLRWDATQRLLHIYPDFSDFHDSPYYVQIDADYCHLYAYGFENTSPAITAEHTLDNIGPLPITHWQSEQQLAAEFAMPPKNCRRIVLLLEIREARGDFEYESNLHVRYRVRFPDNVMLVEGLLQASTQASTARRGTHHFGYCWQLTLLSEECEHFSGDLCHIFFEVISIDGWQRERVEGFAHCAYALQAAGVVDSRRLRCLRPVDTFYDRLNRYFIGGRQHFDLERFFLSEAAVKKPSDDVISFQSRYGYRMQHTGELLVSCQRLTQRNCKLLQPCLSRSSGMTLDDIMLAYREARKRLETIVLQ